MKFVTIVQQLYIKPRKVLRIMRLSLFLLLITTYTWATVGSYAQTTEINISAGNKTIKELFSEIEQNSEFIFLYNDDIIDITRHVTVDKSLNNIDAILKQALHETNVKYNIIDRQIVFYTADNGNVKNEIIQQSNTIKIQGKVVDKYGEPIIGANIIEKGTTNGVISDLNGDFSLTVSVGAIIQISYIGFQSQEISVRNQTDFPIILNEDFMNIEEVVVVGYATQKKTSLSSAVSVVSGDELEKRPAQNLQTALQGTTPGLTVWNKGGEPGENNISFRVRGVGTMSNNDDYTKPLVIVDGIEQSYNDISPTEISSISVLKDASSTAIYGSRAANGVILITTKRGEEGRFRISYNATVDLQNLTTEPEHMGTEDYLRLQNLAYTNRPGGTPLYSEEEIQKYVSGEDRLRYPLPNDWFNRVIEKNAPMQNHTLTIAGGSEKLKTVINANYFKQLGIFPNRDAERYSLRANNDLQILSNLSVSADLAVKRNERNTTNDTGALYHRMIHGSQWAVPRYTDGTYGLSKQGWNPLLISDPDYYGTDKRTNDYTIMNLKGTWEIIKNLTFTSQYGMELMKMKRTNFIPTYQVRDYWNPDNILKNGPSKNSLQERRKETLQSTWNNILTYKFAVAEKHHFNILAGYSQIKYDENNIDAKGYDYYNNSILDLGQSEKDTREISSSYPDWRLRSYFGRVNYDFADKYLFEFNMRYDGSSRFAPGNRYAFFPSFSAAWRISEEGFWENLQDIIPAFKLRGSWGKTGNSNVDLYSYYEDLQLKNYYVFNGNAASGIRQSTLASKEISWETTTQTDIGVDMGFLNNKINLTFDWYYKRTTDILLDLPIPGVIGLNPAPINAGIVDNKGWELGIGYRDKIDKINYSVNFNISDVKNKIVDRAGAGPTYSVEKDWVVNMEGQEFNALWGYKTDGLLTQQDIDNGYPTFSTDAYPGDIKYVDTNNDGKITPDDKQVLGSTIPRFTYGMDISLFWNNFDLNIQFQGVGKQDMAVMGAFVEAGSWEGFTLDISKDYWTPENPNARFPRPQKQQNKNTEASDWWVINASYLRLKNLQLGYTIPKQITQKIHCNRLRLFAGGTNIFTIADLNKWGIDAETNTGRSDQYPALKTWTFGVNVEF